MPKPLNNMQGTSCKLQATSYKLHNVIILLALLTLSTSSQAGLIRSATGVTTDMGEFGSDLDIGNIIDQSGLSAGYTSGVTDFDTYVNTSPTHSTTTANLQWLSQASTTTGNVDFDLGAVFTVSRIALWFRADASRNAAAITSFTLFADDENTFTGATNLGNFTNTAFTDLSVQVYDFTDTQAQFIRMQITGNNGNTKITAHAETAFETVSAVPVPAAAWLMGSALMGLLGFGRKKKA